MNKNTRIILLIALGVLVIGNVYFFIQSKTLSKQLAIANGQITAVDIDQKVVNFSRMFIDGVLNSNKEVDFNERLKLENAVRDIKDEEILGQWNKFVNATTEVQAQVEVKNLLSLLMKKI
jgi:hypothetical protein